MSIKRGIKKGLSELFRYMPGKVAVNTPVLYGELLKGRTALITGGTSGIGFEIARAFLRNGASVIITGRSEEKVKQKCDELRKEFNSSYINGGKLDNCEIQSMKSQFNNLVNKCPNNIDILVNNAGVMNKTSFGSVHENDYDLVMNTDLKGPYFLAEILADYMRRNAIHGNILNISSSSSIRPAINSYHLAKWGIRGLTKGLAKELSKSDIVVNGLAPGPTATEMLTNDDNINRPLSPCGRYATPEEIANLSVVLVSELGRLIVGDTVFATGGCGTLTYDDWN